MLHTLVVLCDLPRVHMSFGMLYLLVAVTLMSVWIWVVGCWCFGLEIKGQTR